MTASPPGATAKQAPPPAPSGSAGAAAPLRAALDAFVAGGDPVELFAALAGALRPGPSEGADRAVERVRALQGLLDAEPGYRQAVGARLGELFSTYRQVELYTDGGLLPPTTFFAELWRKIGDRMLPSVPRKGELRDAIRRIVRPPDAGWLDLVPDSDAVALLKSALAEAGPAIEKARARTTDDMLEATAILAHRTCALGLDPEITRRAPSVEGEASPFMALVEEIHRFVALLRAHLADPEKNKAEDEKHARVLAGQCRETLETVLKRAVRGGASLSLAFTLRRLEQHLDRLERLLAAIGARLRSEDMIAALEPWAKILKNAVVGEERRNSVRVHFALLTGLLARRVTENTGEHGEHYITSDRAGWASTLRGAMGAGIIIAVLAMVKILLTKVPLPPLFHTLAYGLNYALGFVLVYILHLTIATKQPAMTAATIATALGKSEGRLKDLDRLAGILVDTARTQHAAIFGNVAIALPLAYAIVIALAGLGAHPVGDEKAHHLLHDIDPIRSLAIFHAAIAGVWLFCTGLVSGYFDNRAAEASLGERLAQRLRGRLGAERAERVARYIDENMGGLAGNVFLGLALGSTGAVGAMLGLPIDIRHIAFASANFGYALAALGPAEIGWPTIALSCAGLLAIAVTNLTVSFGLAFMVALRSQRVEAREVMVVLPRLWERVRRAPWQLVFPPRRPADPAESSAG